MTIRHRLRLILAVVVLMAALRTGLVLSLDRAEQQAAADAQRSSDMLTLVIQLGVVTLDYRLNQEARPFALIRRKLDQLGEQLARLPRGDPSAGTLVARLERHLAGMRGSFEKLATIDRERGPRAATAGEPDAATDPRSPVYRLANRLSAEALDLAAGARGLLTLKQEEVHRLETLRGQVTFGLDLLTALLVLGLLVTLSRSLLRSLDALGRGARALAAGAPGARVALAGRDELDALAATFNDMAGQLEQRQAQLEDLNRDLADLNRDLERRVAARTTELTTVLAQRQETIEALNRSNEELRQFAYVASHDLQEPLRMVASYTDLLRRRHGTSFDAEGQRYLDYLAEGAQRMQALILDLLSYSRIANQGLTQVLTPLDQPLDAALADLAPRLAETGAVIDRGPLPTLAADPGQLHRLFLNLLGNALKFRGPATPRIGIAAVRDGTFWRIAVCDNGIGIDPEYREQIFTLFQRLHSRAEYPGTGIGLAVCRRIVERHGGRIWVESSPEAGATFCFTLPDAPPVDPPPGSGPTDEKPP